MSANFHPFITQTCSNTGGNHLINVGVINHTINHGYSDRLIHMHLSKPRRSSGEPNASVTEVTPVFAIIFVISFTPSLAFITGTEISGMSFQTLHWQLLSHNLLISIR